MALQKLLKKGMSSFLDGNDKGTSIDTFKSNFDIGARSNRFQADFYGCLLYTSPSPRDPE